MTNAASGAYGATNDGPPQAGAPSGLGFLAHPMLRAFQHRDYRLFFFGQLISLIGTWMQSVAQSWLVYRLSGSAMLLGVVTFSGQFPVLILSPAGGSLADVYPRRRIIVATQTAAMMLAFALATLALTGTVRIWHIFVMASLLGVVNAFDIPARQAFLVELVGRAGLMNAIALNSSMFNGARIIGPAVAGILVSVIGEGWCFFLNSVSYLAVIAGLLAMHPARQNRRTSGGTAWERIIEGFQFVARTAPIRALLLLLGLISLTGMPYAVLMPIFADRILEGGPRGLGLLMGASGVGAFLGALALARRQEVRGLGRWIVASTASFGLCLNLFAFSRSFWLSMLILVPTGFSLIVQTAASNTLIQAMVPDALRGRVMAVYSMMFMGMAPFGGLLAGTLAERWGAPATVALGGAVCIVGAVVFGWRLPSLRPEGRRLLLAHETGSSVPTGGSGAAAS